MSISKNNLLKQAKNEADKLLIAKVLDMVNECEKHYHIVVSNFLNGYEAAVARNVLMQTQCSFGFYGGYDEAERSVLYIHPDYLTPSYEDLTVSVIKVTGKDIGELSHRDYLGSILALGLKREKIGDIAVNEESAFVICKNDIADYIISQLRKIGNKGVKLELQDINSIIIPKKKFKESNCTVASLRLDGVVSAVSNISRSMASDLIKHEAVTVNWMPVDDTSFNIKEADLLSIKGYGRFLIYNINGLTRKGRTSITVRKFI